MRTDGPRSAIRRARVVRLGFRALDARARIVRDDSVEWHRMLYGQGSRDLERLARSLEPHSVCVAVDFHAFERETWRYGVVSWPLWRVLGARRRRRALIVVPTEVIADSVITRLRVALRNEHTKRVYPGSAERRGTNDERRIYLGKCKRGWVSFMVQVTGCALPEDCYGITDLIMVDACENVDTNFVRMWTDGEVLPRVTLRTGARVLIFSTLANGRETLARTYQDTEKWTWLGKAEV